MSDITARLTAALESRYRIEREIGAGGMATVYLADDLKHERKVALKVLKPELAAVVGAERFLAEIKTTANLQHPHILPLFDSGEADGFLFYVMPYVEGETLRDRIDREKQLPVAEAVALASKVAGALHQAHEHGVIHRDIKPANILLKGGEPVVADFGISLAVGAGGGSRLTETGLSVGTPYYMSPEQATGDQAVGPASDTYALACVLYEMLVGEAPYLGNTAQAVLGKIIAGKPVSASEHRASVPPNVDAALRCALEKLPADRFTSAQEFARALADEHFRHGEVAAGVGASASPWNRLTTAFAAVAAVCTLGFGWSLLRPEPSRPVTRVSVSFPEDQSFHANQPAFDISDDGSLFVYKGVGDQGQPQLWARPWDALDATPIRDTEGAGFPDISPDGLEVAFTTATSLRVVPLQGGVPRTLVEFGGQGCCAAWSPDGAWVYYTEGAVGVMRVPAAGGEAETVAANDAGLALRFNILADVLPGGRGIVFASVNLLGGGNVVQAMDLETGEAKVLTSGTHPRYTASGHLLFIDDAGTLLAAPFDVKRLALTATAVPVAEGLMLGQGGIGFYAVSETGKLVYRSSSGTARGGLLTPAWVGRDGTAREIDPGWRISGSPIYSSVALSPDGTRLALSIPDARGTFDLWVKRLDSGPLTRLTFEGTQNYRATWSPNSRSLTFVSNRDAGRNGLWSKRADGSGTAELVLTREAQVMEGLYSSDGAWLVFREGQTIAGDIYAIRPGVDSVAVPLEVTRFQERSIALSPNGRWLTYVSNRSGREEVYVRPFPDAGASLQQVSADGGNDPVWAHSGRELFYRNAANEMVAVEVTDDASFAVGQQTVLFSMADYLPSNGHSMYDVSPDDQRFVMLQVGGVGTGDAQLILVENFFEELKQLVGN